MGYTGTVTPGRDPAQRARGPGLVHGLHAVPGRDQPGSAGGAAQLPDDGQRADRAARRQRLAARRGDGRRRGDGDGPPAVAGRTPTASSSTTTPTRRRSPCWPPGPSRSASTSSSATSTTSTAAASARCSACPTSTGAVVDWRAAIERVHAAGGLAVVATDLLACVLTVAAGPARRRHRRRLGAALRRADGLRRPARRVHRRPRDARPAPCPGASSASAPTPPGGRRCAWRCRPASSTSAGRRRRRTSARPRCCWPTSPASTPPGTVRPGWPGSPSGSTG